MRVIAVITEPTVAKRILKCMGLPPRAPPLTPAPMFRSESTWFADPPTPTADELDFDQSPPDPWAAG